MSASARLDRALPDCPGQLRRSGRRGGAAFLPFRRTRARIRVDFFFPDSQDQIDPSFDFEREASSPDRVRQRDDRYAHEVISPAPYTGMLLSKALVDGPGASTPSRNGTGSTDSACAASSASTPATGRGLRRSATAARSTTCARRSRRTRSRRSIDFYEECGFDYGISVDHVILGYIPDATDVVRPLREAPQDWIDRQELTLEYAAEFLRRHRAINASFTPLGVAQGWSPTSYAHAVQVLQTDGLRLHRARRHGAAEDSRDRGLPAGDRGRPPPRDALPSARDHAHRTGQALRALRGRELRQHLAVPAGVQRRSRQLLQRRSASTSLSGSCRSTPTIS